VRACPELAEGNLLSHLASQPPASEGKTKARKTKTRKIKTRKIKTRKIKALLLALGEPAKAP